MAFAIAVKGAECLVFLDAAAAAAFIFLVSLQSFRVSFSPHCSCSEYSITVEGLSETQLALCHPERELLPLVLAHCHYTLVKGRETNTSYNLLAIQRDLCRRFLAGKPLIQVVSRL